MQCLKVHKKPYTPPEVKQFAPEKWWLEDNPFLLGLGNFSGVNSLLNFVGVILQSLTLPKTNIAPKNGGFQ